MTPSENKLDNVPPVVITDHFAWLKRWSYLTKKSGLILKKQGPFFLVKKVFTYMKGKYEFKKAQNKFIFSSQPTKKGINVVGYLCAETGLGESARTLINAIKTTRIQHSLIHFKLYWLEDHDKRFKKEFTQRNPHNVNIIVINPEGLDFVLPDLRKEFFENRYNIGYWAWELPDIPTEWKKYESHFDEIWVPSDFVKQAIIKKINKPVTIVPHSIKIKSFDKYGRDHFGLNDEDFLFSFIFDYNSLFERKNPVAVVRSFKKAFHGNEDVSLVIKCSNPANFGAYHHLLLEEIEQDKRIKIISKRLTRDEIYSLLDVSDAYVSLHRAEGYGLTMAEAMFLGKPVICTNYSGNLDFTKENNSFLVNYKIISLTENIGPYKEGDKWADPDIDQAAKFMIELYDNKELRNEIGNLGRDYIHRRFNPESIGKIIEKRLEQINQLNDDGNRTLPLAFASHDASAYSRK
jgi:glycosyltransferase involved in cell wall biosynthesis